MDRLLPGGTTKIDRRRSIEGEIDRRRPIEVEIDRRRSIVGKEERRRRGEEERSASFPRAVLACASSPPSPVGDFPPARVDRTSPLAERKIEAITTFPCSGELPCVLDFNVVTWFLNLEWSPQVAVENNV
ncbi:hypothetical protein GW17_00054589 [Ensete ventricosum]|nr:hypothetical protein GW17_00054589 [Ensete ventricosum]